MLILQAAPGEPALIPWWVLYVVVLGATWGLFRLSRRTGWAIPLGCFTFVPVMIIGMLALPSRMWFVMLTLGIVPLVAALLGFRRRDGAVAAPGALPHPRAMAHIPKQLLAGQPRPDSVLRSKMMAGRFAAGMPRDAEFVARMRYVSGIGEMTARPVDLFLGGGQLWVAPLKGDVPPIPIPARNVLRVDVWPEPEGPPTLRVSWSPLAGELTAEMVMQAMPNVPAELVTGQIQAIAGVLTTAIADEAREAEKAEIAAMGPMTVPPPAPGLSACPNCGETVPPGATACPRCAAPV